MQKIKQLCITGILCVFASVFLALAVHANTYTASPYRDTIDNYDEIFLKLSEAVLLNMESVDLSEYHIEESMFLQVYFDLISATPEFFYLDNKVTYFYNKHDKDHHVSTVKFNYTMDKVRREEAMAEYERELSYIVSLVDRDMSEAEKALWVHDYFVAMFSYDKEEKYFDAYSLFTERTGVCQAYSLGYIAVLRELGMEAVMVTSPEMNHAWNLVRIDGHWYHVDLSYDDPRDGQFGMVSHENFLLTDAEIAATTSPHYAWESAFRCEDTSFIDGIWRGVESRMVYLNGQWYFIDSAEKTLVVADFRKIFRANIYVFEDKWYLKGERRKYWRGVFSGVSEFMGHIFVNTPTEIIIYSPLTSMTSVFLLSEDENDIYGSVIYKNTLEYMTSEAPTQEALKTVTYFEITDFSEEKFTSKWPFEDVFRFDTYYSSMRRVYNLGLFQGVSDTRFAPSATLTRAMFVTVIGRMMGVDTSKYQTSRYVDVKPNLWYSPYVEWASEMGIVNGVGDGKFDPLGELTHEQAYKIIALCARLYGYGGKYIDYGAVKFDDINQISDWAYPSIAYCVTNSLIVDTENTKLYPRKPATRAEAACLIDKFYTLMKK